MGVDKTSVTGYSRRMIRQRQAPPRWTAPDAAYWYKVIAHTAGAQLFNVWHCATTEQAMSTVARWTPSAPPLLPLGFEIRKMRDWLHIETLPYNAMGD